MKILVIGKEGRLEKNSDPVRYASQTFVYVPADATDEMILKAGSDADIMIVDAISKVSANVIDQMPNLKMIHSEGVGYQGVDTKAAAARHIPVCNCKGMNATAVAEQTILLMLGLLRSFVTGDRAVREGRQIEVKESHMLKGTLKEMADCTIGLVGFGDIGKETAKLANAFGAKVIYYCRHRKSEAEEASLNVTYKPLDELLSESDIVSLLVPVTPDTMNMADKAFFDKMKEGAYLVNTARGELVDSKALLEALRSGHLAGAGLDCIAGEPVQADNVLLQGEKEIEDKLILSCHVGGITKSSFKRGYDMVWKAIEAIEKGEMPDHIVNPW
jgi:phosphoglycerate dehydrogenase-like enzyme